MFSRWLSFACHSTFHTVDLCARHTIAYSRFYTRKHNCVGLWIRALNSIFIRFKTPADCVSETYTSVLFSPLFSLHSFVLTVVCRRHTSTRRAWAQTEHNFRWFQHLRVAQLIWHLCTGARLREKRENNNEKNTHTLAACTRRANRQ